MSHEAAKGINPARHYNRVYTIPVHDVWFVSEGKYYIQRHSTSSRTTSAYLRQA